MEGLLSTGPIPSSFWMASLTEGPKTVNCVCGWTEYSVWQQPDTSASSSKTLISSTITEAIGHPLPSVLSLLVHFLCSHVQTYEPWVRLWEYSPSLSRSQYNLDFIYPLLVLIESTILVQKLCRLITWLSVSHFLSFIPNTIYFLWSQIHTIQNTN